jgi:protein TonB
MRASNTYDNGGSKITKIAIVTALHLGVALALINMRIHTPPAQVVVVEPITKPKDVIVDPPTPVDVDTTTKKLDPTIFVPKTDIDVEPLKDTLHAKVLPPGPPPPPPEKGGTEHGTDIVAPPVKTVAKPYTLAGQGECARPDYPASAVRAGESGTVSLALLIGTNGKVSDARVEQTSGSKVLDRAAVAALSMCKFKPATNNGVAEPAWGKIAYVWSLD